MTSRLSLCRCSAGQGEATKNTFLEGALSKGVEPMKNRIISLVLTLSLCASLLVLPAHAYDYQPEPENYWSFFGFVAEYFQNLTGQPFPTVNSMDRLR